MQHHVFGEVLPEGDLVVRGALDIVVRIPRVECARLVLYKLGILGLEFLFGVLMHPSAIKVFDALGGDHPVDNLYSLDGVEFV